MNTYEIDLTTGEVTHHAPVPAGSAHTDDAYFVDPNALKDPEVQRALGDIYQAVRSRRFARKDDAPAAEANG